MKLEDYEKNFVNAREKYLEIMKGENDAAILIKWMIENEINPYGVFHETGYAHQTYTLEGLIGIYHTLNHALVDDGEITFVKTTYYPKILFYWKNEYNFQEHYTRFVQEGCEQLFQIAGYLDNVQEYIAEYERYDAEWNSRITRLKI
jgi:hypothetical protein